jgi:hypothetical protein
LRLAGPSLLLARLPTLTALDTLAPVWVRAVNHAHHPWLAL